MLKHWLFQRMCRSRAEMRVVARHWNQAWAKSTPENDDWLDPTDRRITRSWRLNTLWGALVILNTRAHLVAGAFAALAGLLIVLTLRLTGIWH